MSFAPLFGSQSSSYVYVKSSVSACFASLATFVSSLFTEKSALFDDRAKRIVESWCPICRLESLWESCLNKKERKEKEEETAALVFDPSTELYTVKKLEHIDIEKAIYHSYLPLSARSIQIQLPGESKILAKVLVDDVRRKRGIKHQRSLVDGFYILPGRAGNQTTGSAGDTPGYQQPVELPATHDSIERNPQPVELPANEISPVVPRAVLPAPPRLPIPRPPSPRSRKASPLLALPPRIGDPETRSSRGSSVGSGSIQIAYAPSH